MTRNDTPRDEESPQTTHVSRDATHASRHATHVSRHVTHASRRATLAVTALVASAGCLGDGGIGGIGGGTLSFSAAPVHVTESAVEKTPFEQVSDEPVSFEHTVEARGQSQTVELDAHMVQLERTYQGAPLGSMVVLSVPQIRVLGQQVDVIERIGVTSLLSRARGDSADLQRDQKIDEFQTGVLGSQRTVEVFRGTASDGSDDVDARIYLTRFSHGGDTILAVGIVPSSAGSERDAVTTLLDGVRYDGSVDD